MTTHDIGQYLQKTRKQKKMTQSQVAKLLNVSPQAVSKWECNDSLPDVALLPELAKIYDISIEDILNPGGDDADTEDLQQVLQKINHMIDGKLYQKILTEFEQADSVLDLSVPLDIFMFLTNQQKEQLYTLMFDMRDYEMVIDDIVPYTNVAQRILIIRKILRKKDYDTLEMLIPFTPKVLRMDILEQSLKDGQHLFIEEMLPFLNQEHKDLLVSYAIENDLDYDIIENYMVFFDSKQRKRIHEWYAGTADQKED